MKEQIRYSAWIRKKKLIIFFLLSVLFIGLSSLSIINLYLVFAIVPVTLNNKKVLKYARIVAGEKIR